MEPSHIRLPKDYRTKKACAIASKRSGTCRIISLSETSFCIVPVLGCTMIKNFFGKVNPKIDYCWKHLQRIKLKLPGQMLESNPFKTDVLLNFVVVLEPFNSAVSSSVQALKLLLIKAFIS
jgi:hypothetical protein